jgi:hypothetical protein
MYHASHGLHLHHCSLVVHELIELFYQFVDFAVATSKLSYILLDVCTCCSGCSRKSVFS